MVSDHGQRLVPRLLRTKERADGVRGRARRRGLRHLRAPRPALQHARLVRRSAAARPAGLARGGPDRRRHVPARAGAPDGVRRRATSPTTRRWRASSRTTPRSRSSPTGPSARARARGALRRRAHLREPARTRCARSSRRPTPASSGPERRARAARAGLRALPERGVSRRSRGARALRALSRRSRSRTPGSSRTATTSATAALLRARARGARRRPRRVRARAPRRTPATAALPDATPRRDARGAPFVFLDRDGTLIEDRELRAPARGLRAAAGRVRGGARACAPRASASAVVTNQSGHRPRPASAKPTTRASRRTCCADFAAHGAALDGCYHCPHAPDAGCDVPQARHRVSLLRAQREHGIDLARELGDRRQGRATSSSRAQPAAARCWSDRTRCEARRDAPRARSSRATCSTPSRARARRTPVAQPEVARRAGAPTATSIRTLSTRFTRFQ